MSPDFEQFVDQIKSTADIRSVVSEYVPLKRSGSRWVARCPFHNEKSASFGVNEAMQIFKCFGCGKGGNVIGFVMEIEGLTWWEACKSLAERHGIPLPKRSGGDLDARTRQRAGIFESHEIAQRMFRSMLGGPAGAEARAYLGRRGVTAELAEQFGIGFADRSGQTLVRKLQQEGFGPAQLLETGLVGQREGGEGFYDRFRGRIMFPIQNEQGKIIAYGGRAMSDEDQPKYLNSPETELYKKSQVLYNLNRARKPIRDQRHAILVEGYMDVIGLAGGGVAEAVATCGTALVEPQVRLLHRHTDHVVVNFDSDTAGVNAAERSLRMLLAEDVHVRVLELPGSKDPDEFVREQGADAYRRLLERAPRYFHWLRDRARKLFEIRSAEGRIEAVKYVLPSVRMLHDRYERAAVATELAHDLGIDKQLLLEQVRAAPGAAGALRAQQSARPDLPAGERLLVSGLVHSATARARARTRLEAFLARDSSQQLGSYRLLRALATLGEGFTFDALDSRLEERDRTLLASLVFADEGSAGPSSAEDHIPAQVMECLDRLESLDREAAIDRLREAVRDAERRGDLEEALRLNRELDERSGQAGRRRARPTE